MYKFTLHRTNNIGTDYLALFSTAKWNAKRQTYSSLVSQIPMSSLHGMTYDQILIAPFDKLVEIYYEYQSVQATLLESVKDALKDCFLFKGDICDDIRLFIESRLDIITTTCPYCDCNGIIISKQKDIMRNYQLDHYLDKGKCPFVGLSLYNLVPVCPLCNQTKSTNTFGGSVNETKLLSPFNPAYDFVNRAHFRVKIGAVDDIAKIKTSKNFENMTIYLKYDDEQYKPEQEQTQIMERYYNNGLSMERSELVKYCAYTFSHANKWYYQMVSKVWKSEQPYDALPAEEERLKGKRVRFDKFRRDIEAHYA